MANDQNPTTPSPKATGPRTLPGKKRSRKNALTHGINAKQLLMDGERPEDFSSLCRELQEVLGAKGVLEEQLILDLAMLLVRNRRLLKAETAEVARAAEWLKFAHLQQQAAQASDCNDELVAQHSNPFALERIVTLLTDLRCSFEHMGFALERDAGILRKVYGARHQGEGLPFAYKLLNVPKPDLDKCGKNSRNNHDAKKKTFEMIDKELAKFERLRDEIKEFDSKDLGQAVLAALVPRQEVLDRYLRYESHLSHEFDRVLARLGHAKRLRLGQHSPLQVTLSRR
jgi:hypothetical protein